MCKRVIRYLLATLDEGVTYSPKQERQFVNCYQQILRKSKAGAKLPSLVAFGDADFAGCTSTLKSTSGQATYYRGTCIMWSSKLQTLTALSTCEAEAVAMHDVVKIIEQQGWVDEVDEFSSWSSSVPLLFCDNQSAITVAKSEIPTKRSRHYALRISHLKEFADSIVYVPTDYNLSDPMTKSLDSDKYKMLFYTKQYVEKKSKKNKDDVKIKKSKGIEKIVEETASINMVRSFGEAHSGFRVSPLSHKLFKKIDRFCSRSLEHFKQFDDQK